MKKILFTIQWYPSVLSANALCDEKIIRQLVGCNEYEISCLAYKGCNQENISVYEGVKVFRFRRSLWWNAVIWAKQKKGLMSNVILKIDRIVLRAKQIISIPFYPVVNLKSCVKFAFHAYTLQKKNSYDIVISEHHGVDSLFAGYFLKLLFPKIKFVAILWDPISAKEPARYLPSNFSRKRSVYAEKKLLKYADYVIGMKSSEKTVTSLDLGYDDKHKFFDIPGIIHQNGSGYKCDKLKKGYINIVFSGILSMPDRDPSFIINALNASTCADKINMTFFCTGAGRKILEKEKKTFKGIINICEYIPHADLISVYMDADVLLNFGGVNANMVPSKIFEYMSFCKPILSTYKIDNEASKTYLDRYPLALCIDERCEIHENIKYIDCFLQRYNDTDMKFDDVEREFYINTPSIYIDLIKNIFNNNAQQ